MKRLYPGIATILLLTTPVQAENGEEIWWRVSATHPDFGPVEVLWDSIYDPDSYSGMPKWAIPKFEAPLAGDGCVDGGLQIGSHHAPAEVCISGSQLTGTIGRHDFIRDLSGDIVGAKTTTPEPLRDYVAIATSLDETIQQHIFDAEELSAPAYLQFREGLFDHAARVRDDLEFLSHVRALAESLPFSHFSLKRSPQSAEQIAAYVDTMRVGFEAAAVTFDDGFAVLTVKTMMGLDTIEQIQAAYEQISTSDASALIIDVRGNGGGAFAIKPLIEHVIDEPLDAGYFLSQTWTSSHDGNPELAEVLNADPWLGWSVRDFWRALLEEGLVRVQFTPAEPNFDGPVYVLIDGQSASATELFADALGAVDGVTLVGERSAGEMLSQTMFDLGEGFQLSLPIADYFSLGRGRIEGTGVDPDIDASAALESAIQHYQAVQE